MNYSNITVDPIPCEQHQKLHAKIDNRHSLVLTFHTNGETQYRIIDNPDFCAQHDYCNCESDEDGNCGDVGCPLVDMLLLFDEYVRSIETWQNLETVQSTLDMEMARDKYECAVEDWYDWERNCE